MSYSNIEFKSNPGQFNIDEAQGIVECFVAGIGNKDSVGDVLVPGAFSESLKRRKPRVVWGHNWNDPIGKVLEIYEVGPGDARLPQKMRQAGIGGLYAKVQFNLNSEKGREAFANVAFFGHEQEWSIGYKTIDSIHDPGVKANILKEVELYEVSPVLHGANQLTGTISVKSDDLALADAEKGWGMGMPHHMMGMKPQQPQVIVIREDDDDDDKYESEKPIFAEGLAQPIGGQQRRMLEKEIAERTGSQIRLIEATENTAVFSRMMPTGGTMVFRVSYHTPDNFRTFMFGKPELADGQVTMPGATQKPRTVVPSQMPSMPMQVKPGYSQDEMGMYSFPKSGETEKSDLGSQIQAIEDILMAETEEKVGRTLNRRNLSKLKSVMESLQEIIASAEKEMDTKGYVIPVPLEEAFSTKQLLDPIFDYHRVETQVTEDGIVITSGVTQEFIEAIGVAEKALGRTLRGGPGKARRAGRGLAARFDPNAWDGDGDGLVQEGTPFQRPAIPGVNDRSTRGRVDPAAATQAWQTGQRGMASRGGRRITLGNANPNSLGPMYGYDPEEQDFSSESYWEEVFTDSDDMLPFFQEWLEKEKGKEALWHELSDDEFEELVDKWKSSDAFEKDVKRYAEIQADEGIEDGEAFRSLFKRSTLDKVWVRNEPKERGMASRADVLTDLAIDSDVSEAIDSIVREVLVYSGTGDKDKISDLVSDAAREILDSINFDSIKDSPGKAVSDFRKKLVETLSDEDFLREAMRKKDAINEFVDGLYDAVNSAFEKYEDHLKKTGGDFEDFADLKFELLDDLDGRVSKILNSSRKLFGELKSKKTEDEYKSRDERRKLIASIRAGELPKDWRGRETEDLVDGRVAYEEALEEIVNNSPDADIDELMSDYIEAVREGARKNPDNRVLAVLADVYGDDGKITDEELKRNLQDVARRSPFNKKRGRNEKEVLRGMASRGGGRPGDPITDQERNKVKRDSTAVSMFKESTDYDNAFNSWQKANPGKSEKDFEKSPEFTDALVEFDRYLLDQASKATGIRYSRTMPYSGGPISLEQMTAKQILRDRMSGMSLDDVAEKMNLSREKVRSLEAQEVMRLRDDASPREILAYRTMGLSLEDTGRLFGMRPEDVRKAEAKEMADIRKDMDDNKLIELRMMGFSLDDLAEITGASREDLRKREIQRLRRGPEDGGGARGMASRGRSEDFDGGYDEAYGPTPPITRRPPVGEWDVLVGEEAYEREDASRQQRGMASQNVRPNAGLVKYSTDLLNEKLEDLDSDPQPGMAGATLDKTWAEGVLDGLRDGRLSSDDAINIIGLAGNDVFNEGKKPEGERNQALIDSRIKLSKRLRRSVVDSMSEGDMEEYQANRRRRMGADRGMRSTLSEANRRRDAGLTPGTGDPSPGTRGQRVASSGGEYKPNTEERDAAIIQRLRDIGLSDDEISELTGIDNLPDAERGMASREIKLNNRQIDNALSELDNLTDDRGYEDWESIQKLRQQLSDAKDNNGVFSPSERDIEDYLDELEKLEDAGFDDWEGLSMIRSIISDSRGERGMRSRNSEIDMTLEEYGQLLDTLDKYVDGSAGEGVGADDDMRVLQQVMDKLEASQNANDAVELTSDEISDYLDSLKNIRDNGPMEDATSGDKANINKLISALEGARDSRDGSYETPALRRSGARISDQQGRAFRSSSGTVNPHEKIEMTLNGDDISAMVEDIDALLKQTPNSAALKAAREKFSKAKTGEKITMDKDEYEQLYKDIETAKTQGNRVTSELASLLDQAAESKDGKYVDPNLRGRGGMASRNNGAPSDITEAMQKEYIFWARNNPNLFVAQRILKKYDDNDGQLSARDWRALDTLYTNLSPRGGGRRSGMRSRSGRDAEIEKQKKIDAERMRSGSTTGSESERIGRSSEGTGVSASGLGDIGIRGEGASQRTETPGPSEKKFTGKSFNEVQPDNWESLDIEEKYDWLFSNGKPEVSGMSPAAYEGALKKLIAEEEALEKANTRRARRAGAGQDRGMASRGRTPSQNATYDWVNNLSSPTEKWLEEKNKATLDSYKEWKKNLGTITPGGQAPEMLRGMSSRSGGSGRQGRTMITDEATYFGEIEKNLPVEIRKATEAKESKISQALSLLQDIIKKQEASKTGSRRTNTGSIFVTADEADRILDALMWVIDRQVQRNGNEERISAFAKLVDKMAQAAMSTFVNRDTSEIGSRTTKRTNSRGKEVEIPDAGIGLPRGMASSSNLGGYNRRRTQAADKKFEDILREEVETKLTPDQQKRYSKLYEAEMAKYGGAGLALKRQEKKEIHQRIMKEILGQ